MLVKFLGFELVADNCFTVNDFMSDIDGQLFSLDKKKRLLKVDSTSNEKYHLGLIVTVKSQKTFCQLKSESPGQFTVQVNEVDANANLMEFNFFIINKKTGLGLYQHYHQSCSLTTGMEILKQQYAAALLKKRKAREEDLLSQGQSENSSHRSATKEFNGRLTFSMLVRPDKLEEVLADLDRIKNLELNFTTLHPLETEFSMLSNIVEKHRKRFSFNKELNVHTIIEGIKSVVNNVDNDGGRIEGVDVNGIDRVVRLQNNPDIYGEFDYDNIAAAINNIDINKFAKATVIELLIKQCEEHDHFFDADLSE
tara:strand:- start:20369 stop:21298 length:930 start_codon:yes stop_codon:yes gene_type:complete